MEQSIQVKKIWQQDERTLGIQWSDDEKSLFDVVMLRKNVLVHFVSMNGQKAYLKGRGRF